MTGSRWVAADNAMAINLPQVQQAPPLCSFTEAERQVNLGANQILQERVERILSYEWSSSSRAGYGQCNEKAE